MEKQKVADLAKSFSLSCKRVVNDRHWMHKVTSPSIILITLTVMDVVITAGDPKRGWTSS